MRKKICDFPEETILAVFITGFNFFAEILSSLDIKTSEAAAIFYQDYYSATCRFDNYSRISACFDQIMLTNRHKYELLIQAYEAEFDPIENYDRIEDTTKTRTPDLTMETEAETQRKQTRTVTDNGGTYKETDLSKTAPYDSQTLRDTEQLERTFSGSRTTDESFSGDPDTANSTTTTTGTDEEVIESRIHGNIGVTTSQQMLESSLELAKKMNIFREIEKDIAALLLLQVWI